LICSHLINTDTSIGLTNAQLLCQDQFAFATTVNHPAVWLQLGENCVQLSALYAINHASDEATIFINQLEQQESELRSLVFSICHTQCLVYRTIGYALAQDKAKAQQSLEQLRLRADKRNSPQIAGSFCHAVKHAIGFIASEDERLAQKLLRQVQDIVHKYQHHDLFFAVQWRLWVANPELLNFDQVLSLIATISAQEGLNHEIYQLLKCIRHPQHFQQLFKILQAQNKQMVFVTGLIQVGLYRLEQPVDGYQNWFEQLLPLLQTEDYRLDHCHRILHALGQYLKHGRDLNQLLVLPRLERELIFVYLA
jgi:hypothetical protein